MRIEHDFIGDLEIPDDVYYGVQTMRALENFHITERRADDLLIVALAIVKKSAALANMETGRLDKTIGNALVQAAEEVIAGKHFDQFPLDAIQGGAGTSLNMNMNEVLSNRALEILGHKKGEYSYISPNNHANMAQSTNDTIPTSIRICALMRTELMIEALDKLAISFDKKGEEFKTVLKMGRTHLQDAVPMTLGLEFKAFASSVRRASHRMKVRSEGLHHMNMGATAIGTGLNADPAYIKAVEKHLTKVSGFEMYTAENLVDATNNTDVFADISGGLKVTALALIKICNDLRLLASGPRAGLAEIKLPARQPGSSIMPGKVNPVIPEVVDQVCYQVIGNDLALAMGVENGQLQLNVMEPVMAHNLFSSFRYITNAVNTLRTLCVDGIEANAKMCEFWFDRSVGIVTALLPHIGYEKCSALAKEALAKDLPIRKLIIDKGVMSKEDLDIVLDPEQMMTPGIAGKVLLAKENKKF